MDCFCLQCWPVDALNCVGDPVDVTTGDQFDIALDFRIPWSVPFEWRRYYSTARVRERLPLGWGHTHSYDHRLIYDLDGLTYWSPSGARYSFILPLDRRFVSGVAGGALRRVGPATFRVKVHGQPQCEFHFDSPARPARLKKIFRGRAFQELGYAADGRWVSVSHPAAPIIKVHADLDGRVHRLIWPGTNEGRDRLLWEGHYDPAGNLVEVLDAYGTRQTFSYDGALRMIGRTDRRGYGFSYAFDPAGRCVRSSGEDGTQEVRLRFFPPEGVTIVTRADSGEWQYFHQRQQITQVVDPYGGVLQRTYLPNGSLEREIGPAGEVVRKVVDLETGYIQNCLEPSTGMTILIGDPWFEPLRKRYLPADALGWEGLGERRCRNVIRFPARDAFWLRTLPREVGRTLDLQSSNGEERISSKPSSPRKPMGVPERAGEIKTDDFGRLVSHTEPTGEACRWQYDPNGNIIRYVDYAGSEWRYSYKSWNLQVEEIDPLGHRTTFDYSPLEKPVRIADARNTVTELTFDLKDRMTTRRRNGEPRDLFNYDASEGLIAISDAESVRISIKPGANRRPAEIKPRNGSLRRCEYSETERLIEIAIEGGDAVTFDYNSVGSRTADLRNGVGVERKYSGETLAEVSILGKFVCRYALDRTTGQRRVVDPLGGAHTVDLLDRGVFLRRNSNGVEEVAQYDWHGRCRAKILFQRNAPMRSWTRHYSYSPVGALIGSRDSLYGDSAYEYDLAHRLVAERRFGTSSSYQYDSAGNLISAPGYNYFVQSENRLKAANGRQLEYDQRQNVVGDSLADDKRTYRYDAEDRLVSWESGDRKVSFVYDALGRRIDKTSGEKTTRFIWDGERLAAEVAPGGAVRIYVYLDGTGLTPFAFIDYINAEADLSSGIRYYIFSNQIACPIRVEDEAGAAVWQATIEPYGGATVARGASIELNLRWPGHYFDAETGLHYNRHRYYHPEWGRYLQVDPRDLDGGINLYAYTARPLDQVDVDGLAPCPKKPMVTPEEDDAEFAAARQRADEMAEALRQAINEAGKNGDMHPLDAAGTTLAVMVIRRTDGTYEVVVTGNRSAQGLPPSVRDEMNGARFVGHGDDRPPPIRQGDDDWRYSRTNPRTGEEEDSTHRHAEQRGLRAVDCDPEVEGVAHVAPTRPCCEGCSSAIQTPSDQGGWGGDGGNVSDLGQQSGAHGDWW